MAALENRVPQEGRRCDQKRWRGSRHGRKKLRQEGGVTGPGVRRLGKAERAVGMERV